MSGTDCKALWGKKFDPLVCLIYGVSSWILCFCMHISMNSHPHTHTHRCTHEQHYVVLHQLAGPPSNWPLAVPPRVATQLANLSPSPPPSQSPGSAPTPYSLQIASPSHLSRPIINYWWMGRLTELRDQCGEGKERKEQAWGWGEEVRRARQTVITLTNWLHFYDTIVCRRRRLCCSEITIPTKVGTSIQTESSDL